MLILIADAFDASLPERLAPFGDISTDIADVAKADVLLIRSKTKCTASFLSETPNLKLIVRGGVGLDNVDLEAAKSRNIIVHNTPEASTVAVAEFALTLMLGAINHLAAGHQGLTEGKWLKKSLKRTELFGKTLGLLGIGRIGTAVAKRASAFDMTVIGTDPYVKSHDTVELCDQDALFSRADILSLHTPLTDETREFLNADRIAKLKAGVVIINTGRGECVDESAMADALKSGHVACYATDVWTSDPPPTDSPLLSAPNMLMAPHIGANSKENLLRIGDAIVKHVDALVNGK